MRGVKNRSFNFHCRNRRKDKLKESISVKSGFDTSTIRKKSQRWSRPEMTEFEILKETEL